MHTHPQRDDFIKVNIENVKSPFEKNFKKYTMHVSSFNTQYDYRSIMHYNKFAFADNEKIPTIIPNERVTNMGQRLGNR